MAAVDKQKILLTIFCVHSIKLKQTVEKSERVLLQLIWHFSFDESVSNTTTKTRQSLSMAKVAHIYGCDL
jgi:hypothetical protein